MKESIETGQQLSMFDAMKLLNVAEDRLFVTSLDVAERFGKMHKNVIRDIEGIECSAIFYRLNFEPIEYVDVKGRPQPLFRMSRDGFSLLVMGFTGAKAMLWKERYIQAFNMMEAELLRRRIDHAETRGRSKTIRISTTDSYKEHGASEWFHYSNNTDMIYKVMFGGTAAQLRSKWNLPPKCNVRDHLTTDQLNTIIQIEGAITLQLDHRRITNPDHQVAVVRHVCESYKTLIEAPIPALGRS